MSEYFLVYDAASGVVLWRGSGIAGTAAMQPLEAGQAILAVSAEVWGASPLPVKTIQDAVWDRAKAQREIAEGNGCETPVGRVDTDLESLVRITGAVQAASIALAAGDQLTLDWTMADNSVVTLDAAALVAMGRAVALHVDAVHQHGRQLRQLIEAAPTAEAVLAIDIASGWPASEAPPA